MALVGADGKAVTTEDAPDQPAAPVEVVTAFIIFQTPDGRVLVTEDLNAPLVPQRKPVVPDELASMAGVVVSDAQAHKQAMLTAEAVVGRQVQLQQQAMEARQAVNAMAQTQGLDPSKLSPDQIRHMLGAR